MHVRQAGDAMRLTSALIAILRAANFEGMRVQVAAWPASQLSDPAVKRIIYRAFEPQQRLHDRLQTA